MQRHDNESDVLGVREVGEGGVSATEESLTVDEPLTEEGRKNGDRETERERTISYIDETIEFILTRAIITFSFVC